MQGDKCVIAHQEFCDATTNNREELKAILWVLENYGHEIDPNTGDSHIVYSDSAYSVNTINIWMYSWATKGWLKSDNKTPENLDIIKKIFELNKQGSRIRLLKVAGHKGIKGNELADDLATGRIKVEDLIKDKEFICEE